MLTTDFSPEMTASLDAAIRRELLRLARQEEERAADEAAQVQYWQPCPPSVDGHRAAAEALRALVA